MSAVLVVASCGGGSSTESDVATASTVDVPEPSPPSSVITDGVQPESFTTVTAQIVKPDGETCEVCLWLADTRSERGRGLMGVTDIGAPVGMVFRYDEPVTGAFYMFQTPTSLSIAWFDAEGALVAVAEMPPCGDDNSAACPRYRPEANYQIAIEVFEGGLDELGIGPGSTMRLIDGSESLVCALDT